MTRILITILILVGTAVAFAIPLRCWWLARRGGQTVRWRVHGEEYETRRR